MVITTAQLDSTKPELRFCAGSNPAHCMSEICDGEDLWHWFRLEIRLNAFRQLTTPPKQFIIIIYGSFFDLFPPPPPIPPPIPPPPQPLETQKSELDFLRYGVRQTEIFVIFGYFLPFYPPNIPENQNFEKMKKASGDVIILHLCTKNHTYMMYAS